VQTKADRVHALSAFARIGLDLVKSKEAAVPQIPESAEVRRELALLATAVRTGNAAAALRHRACALELRAADLRREADRLDAEAARLRASDDEPKP